MTSLTRPFEFAIAFVGLAFMSGTLSALLSEPGATSAPLVQAVGGALGLYSVLAILALRGCLSRIFGLYWLVLLPVLFATASLMWTADFGLTVRRAGALGLTTAFGLWLALRFSPKELFLLMTMLVVSVIALNFAMIQLNPARGIHQASDILAEHHAGSWRGMFGHKNDFGRLIAFSVSVLAVAFFFRAGGRAGRLVAAPLFALAILMIMNSNSAQAVMLAVSVPAGVILLLGMRWMSPVTRALLFFLLPPIAFVAASSAQLILEAALGFVGRDATLTGRTAIWEGTLLAMEGQIIAGGGYGAGWQVVGPRLLALSGIEVGHAHNGYLDAAADIGLLGLGLTLAVMLWNMGMAFRNLMVGVLPEISTLALTVLLFSFIGNVAGSFLLLHNSIYWVVIVATYCQLIDAARAGRIMQRPTFVPVGRYEERLWVT